MIQNIQKIDRDAKMFFFTAKIWPLDVTFDVIVNIGVTVPIILLVSKKKVLGLLRY